MSHRLSSISSGREQIIKFKTVWEESLVQLMHMYINYYVSMAHYIWFDMLLPVQGNLQEQTDNKWNRHTIKAKWKIDDDGKYGEQMLCA